MAPEPQWTAAERNKAIRVIGERLGEIVEIARTYLDAPAPISDEELVIPIYRPHIIGWSEPSPAVVEYPLEQCETCGKTGAHDVVVLGQRETALILRDLTPPEAEA